MEWNFFKRKKGEPAKVLEKDEMRSSGGETFKNIIGGRFLTEGVFRKYYPYVFLLVILAFVYIDNRYYCEKQLSTIADLEKQLVNKKYESLTISSKLIQMSRQSQVSETVAEKGLGLKVSNVPAIKIE